MKIKKNIFYFFFRGGGGGRAPGGGSIRGWGGVGEGGSKVWVRWKMWGMEM